MSCNIVDSRISNRIGASAIYLLLFICSRYAQAVNSGQVATLSPQECRLMAESRPAPSPPLFSSDDSTRGPSSSQMGFLRKRRIPYFLGLIGLSYLGLQIKLRKKEEMLTEARATKVLTRFKERRERLTSVCDKYRANDTRVEHSALFEGTKVNQCTNNFFTVNGRDFSICNVLKGGSLSWKEFFRYYNIPSKFLDDCLKSGNCPQHVRRHLVQVF